MTTVSSQVYYESSHLETEQVLFDGWVVAALSSQVLEPSTMWVADLQSQTGPFQLLRIFRLTGAPGSHIFMNTGARSPG